MENENGISRIFNDIFYYSMMLPKAILCVPRDCTHVYLGLNCSDDFLGLKFVQRYFLGESFGQLFWDKEILV